LNDGAERKREPRSYRAPRREAAAARTREAILEAAKRHFEDRGWAGATVAAIADTAGVSQKTVEAVFGTKASVLRATVDYAIRGDVDPRPMPRRDVVARMEAAATTAAMLDLHAAHLRSVNDRSARLARAVEQAAPADASVRKLWRQMDGNRAYGVRWAAATLLAKPDRRPRLQRRYVESTFWVAFDWGTYRTLTEQGALDAAAFERWLRRYYRSMLER
jgi:AcrR family transcriptional regulator